MRARFFGLFVIASLVLLFAMPAVAQQDAGTTLRVMPHADLSILDPHWTGAYITHGLRHAVCNGQRVAAALFVADLQPVFDEQDPVVDNEQFELRADLEEAAMLRLRAEAHDVLDTGPVVPAAVEDHDLARGRKVRQVTLQI